MRNLLSMDTAPRDGSEVLAWRRDWGGFKVAMYTNAYEMMDQIEVESCDLSEDDLSAEDWFTDWGYRLEGSEEPTHWLPLPGTILPMSTAPKDGRRIQVAVPDAAGKVRWEMVEWSEVGGHGEWDGIWMGYATPDEGIESNWRGWFPCPGEE